MDELWTYLPPDRRAALAANTALEEHTSGAAMFADVTGFTPLAEALVQALGPRQGAEELTGLLNQVYSALIAQIERFGGSVVGFCGDAITCWFGDTAPSQHPATSAGEPAQAGTLRALAAALAMRRAMAEFAKVPTRSGATAALMVKIAVAAGSARRLLIGDPQIQVLEVLVGGTIERLDAAAHLAERDEVLIDSATLAALGVPLRVAAWRTYSATQQRAAVIAELPLAVAPTPWPALPTNQLTDEQIRPWVPPAVFARVRHSADPFLAELRPAAALMLQLGVLDYDGDSLAGATLDAYIRQVQAIVARYGGHLVDLTMADKGGFLYAAFGALHAHEDDALRAALAALELRDLRLTPASDAPRIGLSRGTMRTGPYGGTTRRTYGVLGDEVNLACRLMSAAVPGQILASAQLQRALEANLQLAALPAISVKGKRAPVALFEVLAKLPARPALPEHAATSTPLIGRADEYAVLAGAVAALLGGASGLLVADGEAGIGKSRLLAELAGLLRDRGVVAFSGAGQYIEQAAYAAWRPIFGNYFGLDQALTPAERQARAQARLAAIAPELLKHLPLVNDLLNLGLGDTELTRALDAAQRGEQQAALLAALLQAQAAQQPLAILLDDAHMLDARSLSLAIRAAQLCMAPGGEPGTAAPRLLLVLAMRLLDASHPAMPQLQQLLSLRGARRLSLGRLTPSQTVALAAGWLGVAEADLPAEVGALVGTRAGGNPLFAEELVAALLAEGAISVEQAPEGTGPARYLVRTGLRELGATLPDTLQGLILGRIDRLPPAERLTLKIAAAIGPTFEYQLLRAIRDQQAAIGEPALKNQLRALAATNFTQLEAPEPQLAYRFKHILTQEAAYQSLLYAKRRELHRQIASWYEQTFGSAEAPSAEPATLNSALAPYIPLLAYHYRRAEDSQREQIYVGLLGVQSLHASDFEHARACFERAQALTPPDHSQQHCWLTAQLGRAALLLGDATTAEQRYRQSHALAIAAGDRAGEARACFELGMLAYQRQDFPVALQQLERSLALYRAVQDRRGEVRALDHLGAIAIALGEDAKALEYYQQAIALGQTRRNRSA